MRLGTRGGLAVAAVLGVAALLRLAWVVGAQWEDPLVGDAIYYSAQAEVLAEGRGFEHPYTGEAAADHPPLTPVVFAPASWLDPLLPGDVIQAQRLLGAALGVVAVWALGLLAREVGGDRTALVAMAIAAVYPGLWINDGLIMSETPTAVVTALLLWVLIRWSRGSSPAWLVGLVGGVATLTRAELALLVALAVVPLVLLRRPIPWRDLAVVPLVAALVLAPWTLRNLARFEEPVLVSTNDGLTLIGANCDRTYGEGLGFWDLRCAPPIEGDQSEVSAAYRDLAFDYIAEHKGELPKVVAARIGRVWSLWRPNDMVFLNEGEDREPAASRLALWGYWALAPVAAAGTVLLWWRRERAVAGILLSTAAMVTLTAALFYGIVRFRLPAEVAMVAVAAVAVEHLLSRRRSAPADPSAAG